ncbi:hypothetical protein NE237_026936 [Protea cynaroides]|uniref:Uncharacterized protein n=1 Tax=Protea cynaroides TaxID=273540 RepID=A0A9Q0JRG2_9MAGN|nr:hypothetical protein NE237_026936 [Protea cynaroides]
MKMIQILPKEGIKRLNKMIRWQKERKISGNVHKSRFLASDLKSDLWRWSCPRESCGFKGGDVATSDSNASKFTGHSTQSKGTCVQDEFGDMPQRARGVSDRNAIHEQVAMR